MSGVPVQVCDACGHAVFPERVLCPACGGRDWHTRPAERGRVEEVTTHRAGGAVASVRSELGPVLVARLPGAAAPGCIVVLTLEAGAPVARPENEFSA